MSFLNLCIGYFFFINIQLFIFGGAGSSLLLRLFSSCVERGLLPSCGVWQLCFLWFLFNLVSLVAEHGLQAPGLQLLPHVDSVVVP